MTLNLRLIRKIKWNSRSRNFDPRGRISGRRRSIANLKSQINSLFIVDAHLDLAYNALHGREVLLPAAQQTPGNIQENGIPSVGLPDLRRGSVGLICATIYCEPDEGKGKGYRTADQANPEAKRQAEWYQKQFAAGEMKLVRAANDLPSAPAQSISTIILMEGAD